jgi:hypothetical protein
MNNLWHIDSLIRTKKDIVVNRDFILNEDHSQGNLDQYEVL